MHRFLIIATLTIILAAASWALLSPGIYPTHDYVHGVRLAEMERAVLAGHIPARWSANFGYGYGMPLFQFYGPLPYYVGLLFYSVLDFSLAESIKILFFLSSVGTLVLSYFLGKKLFNSQYAGLIAAAAITLAPYRAVNMFVRGALNESWGMMGGVGSLLGAVLIYRGSRWGWLVFSLSILIMATSHNLATFIFVPFIGIFCLALLWLQRGKKSAVSTFVKFLWSGILGLGLSSFYVIPSFFEKQFTQVEQFVTSGFFSYIFHFLYIRQFVQPNWAYGGSILGPEDDMSFFLGYGQLAAAVMAGLLILAVMRRAGIAATLRKYRESLIFIVVAGLCLVLAVGISLQHALPIWKQFESILAFVQFPWRYLTSAATFLGIIAAGGVLFITDGKKRVLYVATVIVVVLINAQYFRPETPDDVSDAHYYNDPDRIASQMSGILEDYMPAGFVKPETAAPARAWCLPEDSCSSTVVEDLPHRRMIDVSAETDVELQLAIADFPGWVVYVEDVLIEKQTNDLGVLTLDLPAGQHQVRAEFRSTALREWSDRISLASFGVLLAVIFQTLSARRKSQQKS